MPTDPIEVLRALDAFEIQRLLASKRKELQTVQFEVQVYESLFRLQNSKFAQFAPPAAADTPPEPELPSAPEPPRQKKPYRFRKKPAVREPARPLPPAPEVPPPKPAVVVTPVARVKLYLSHAGMSSAAAIAHGTGLTRSVVNTIVKGDTAIKFELPSLYRLKSAGELADEAELVVPTPET